MSPLEVRVRRHERKIDFSRPESQRALMTEIDRFTADPYPGWAYDPYDPSTGRIVRQWSDGDSALIEEGTPIRVGPLAGMIPAIWEYKTRTTPSMLRSGIADSIEDAKLRVEETRRGVLFSRQIGGSI
jgi:hypothetical protein